MSEEKKVLHVGLILDGNRRWAKSQGLSVMEGHRAGHETLKSLIKPVKELGISHVSAYVFSTENWNRAKDEVENLMELFRQFAAKDIDDIHAQNVRVVFIGSDENVPKDLFSLMREAEQKTKNNTDGTLAICFNYGGQQEIADACRSMLKDNISPADITPDRIAEYLYAPQMPPLDLVIRTSGEQRLSNFMLWRAAYAELFFTDTHWPAFSGEELGQIVGEYKSRNRRFGA